MSGRPQLVVGRPAEVEPAAAALALAPGGGSVVIHLRDAGAPVLTTLLPATRHARRLAHQLSRAGVEARALGRLAVVEAAGEGADALAGRVELACGSPPVVALLRGRSPADEALVERSEVVLCQGTWEPAAGLLLAELERRRIPVQVKAPPTGVAGLAARAGLRLPLGGADGGQAAIETVGLLPLLLAVVLAAGQLLAAGVARELAAHAATAGAAAVIQGRDATGAARRALPGWSRGRAVVKASGRRVAVRLRPPGPAPLARLLEARSVADAGPSP